VNTSNLGEILAGRAREFPSELAIVEPRWPFGWREVTYAALAEEADSLAARFQAAGLQRGDAVLVLVPVSAKLYAVLAALFRCGLTAVFLDPSAGKQHVARCVEMVPPRAVVRSPKAMLLDFSMPSLRRIPRKLTVSAVFSGWSVQKVTGADPVPGEPSDAALITFTSGSTGQPKAAVRSHAFLWRQYEVLRETMAFEPGEREITTLPIFVLANLAAGIATVIPPGDLRRPGFIAAKPVLQSMQARAVSRITASPSFLERLVEALEGSGATCESVCKIFTGGAPVFPTLVERARRTFPNARVVSVYGSTEAEPIAELDAAEVSVEERVVMQVGAGLLVGKPIGPIDCRVIRAAWGQPLGPFSRQEFDAMAMPLAEAGEVVVAGEHVLPGYLNRADDPETKISVEGRVWHRTGDLGRFDAAGCLWLLGRASAVIGDSHGTLYPFALEVSLSFLPSLRRSAVIGADGKRFLFVEWKRQPGNEEKEVLQRRAEAASVAQVIEEAIPVDARHNAKVNYPALRERLARRLG
jgi:acyl-CoA synthetase (AMP-forming)/AMP-acid ligase II